MDLRIEAATVPVLLDLFGALVLFELTILTIVAYRRVSEFLLKKSGSLVCFILGFLILGTGHLTHAISFFLLPDLADLILRASELISAILFAYPYLLKRDETILTSSMMFLLSLGGAASIIFLYVSIIFYKIYCMNRNVDTMLFSTAFMLLFLSEVLISLTVFYPLIYSGYIARLFSFIILLYFTLRVRR